jgi:hypothetical protein
MYGLEIDTAPGKELIPLIFEHKTFQYFNEFYTERVKWSGYPLIHDRFITYGIFHDFVFQNTFDAPTVAIFLDYAIQIAQNETDSLFINALFLVKDISSISKNLYIPTAQQVNDILDLKSRVEKRSFYSNIITFWESLLENIEPYLHLPMRAYEVNKNDFSKHIDINFPSIDNNTPASCPVSIAELNNYISEIRGEYDPLKFVRSAQIENKKFWMWLYTSNKPVIYHWYIYVYQNEKGEHFIKQHSMHSVVNETPEMLLLNLNY